MAQASPQFSAAQILEAGRRAEADGRTDYAVQFYRHLTDHHGRSPEAASAREALGRLATRRPTESTGANGHANSKANGHAAAETTHSPVPAQAATSEQARRPVQPGTAIAIAPVGSRRGAVTLPEPRDHYRLGRTIARLVGAVGWLFVLAGVTAGVLSIVALTSPGAVAGLARFGGAQLIGVVPAGATLLAGVATVFLAQLARALFDMANAARDTAAVSRAAHDH